MVNITNRTNIIVKAALLVALGFVLSYFEIPVLPMFPWLKVDLSAVPILLGGFAFGPLVGVAMEFFRNFLVFTVKGSSSGGVGEIANFLIVGSYVLTASFIYLKTKTLRGAILGTMAGTAVMMVVAMLANVYILIPLFFPNGMEANFFRSYVTFGIPAFNLIKGGAISFVGVLFYSKVAFLIKKESGFRKKQSSAA